METRIIGKILLAATLTLGVFLLLPAVFGKLDGDSSTVASVQTHLRAVETALTTFHSANGRFPSESEGIAAAARKLSDGKGTYPLTKDRWGNNLVYRLPTPDSPIYYSIGPNEIDEAGKGDDVRLPSE